MAGNPYIIQAPVQWGDKYFENLQSRKYRPEEEKKVYSAQKVVIKKAFITRYFYKVVTKILASKIPKVLDF